MHRGDFHYELPVELIAQFPPAERGGGRLLVLDVETGRISDRQFSDFESLVRSEDLLVFNDTRVVPARVAGRKASGGRVEVMLERIRPGNVALAQIRASRSPPIDSLLELEGAETVRVTGRAGALFRLQFQCDVQAYFERHGAVPLPPYIERPPSDDDVHRYQTVFARKAGAVAAPTAGLHFDDAVLRRLRANAVTSAFVTLHVGSGTFAPLRETQVEQNVLHEEYVEVSEDVCEAVAAARARGGRVIAIGTTVVRALETAAADGRLAPFEGESRLFIYPGYEFRIVDAMLTNFHLPESSLLMLVAAFAGTSRVLAAYRHAVRERYRFFSYGDAMFVSRVGPHHAL
ncbi:MAG: tRNA preQ1(34) S-adenosylmethionine ribosyltransferase-isomerase QueA [Gammaproteobacteria bacterium]|jgi:S-adenosylmethionine:tRNA ribosyltransferase-isomerase